MLTWDNPDSRGTWADHGVEGLYVGPALDHFRAFRIWVPQHSALRISGTVWWFRKPVRHDESAVHDTDNEIAYPPTKHRPCSAKDGSDLLGRVFPEPELGPCLIAKLGPIMERKMLSRAQKTARANSQPIALGTHHSYSLLPLPGYPGRAFIIRGRDCTIDYDRALTTTACKQHLLQFTSTDHANWPRAGTTT